MITRAAIFAGATALVPACGASPAPQTQQRIEVVQPTLPGETAQQQAEREAQEARDAEALRQRQGDHINARPYGAPPRRDDFV